MNLYSAWYCPFAQRTWMALIHKDVRFEYIETDPYLKSAEWLEVSQNVGQVPVLEPVADLPNRNIVGSIPSLEYLNDRWFSSSAAVSGSEATLYPSSPHKRARVKHWIEFIGQDIIPFFYRALKAPSGSEAGREAFSSLEAGLMEFARHMDAEGTYFMGSTLSAVDIAFAPFALRIDILLAHYRNYHLPQTDNVWQRYHRWQRKVLSHPSMKGTQGEQASYQDRLIAFYMPYSQGGGQQDVTLVPQRSVV